MKKNKPKPPEYLNQGSRRWFEKMTEIWAFGQDEVELLAQAATQLERIEQARASIAEQGPLIQNRYGNMVASPAVEVERRASETFARLVRQLKLEREPRRRVGRPSLEAL
jgi:hypothetical protein